MSWKRRWGLEAGITRLIVSFGSACTFAVTSSLVEPDRCHCGPGFRFFRFCGPDGKFAYEAVKGTRHREEQIIAILKRGEAGLTTAKLCRQHGIIEQTYYGWKAKWRPRSPRAG